MPGYILHLTEAKTIVKELQLEGYSLSDEWVNAFYLGNLLPDTKIKREKITSHFWNPESLIRQAIAPDLDRFFQKYRSQLKGPLILGYLSHLHLDACFVNSFWPSMWLFLDEEKNPETLQEHIRYAWLKVSNKEIPVKDFFSSAYYYGDYSRMNAYLLNKYRLNVPVYDSALDCPVEEVHIDDLKTVLEELQYLCDTVQPGAEKELTVFDLPSLEKFIAGTAEEMADLLLKEYLLQS